MKQINLLSQTGKVKVKFVVAEVLAVRALKFVGGVFLVVCLAFGIAFWYTSSVKSSAKAELVLGKSQEDVSDYGKIRQRVQIVNGFVSDATTVFGKVPKFSSLMERLVMMVPQGVSLQSVSVDIPKKQVTFAGFALSREGILDFHKALSTEKQFFSSVDFPLENLAKPKNAQFHFTATLTEGGLK